MNRVNLIGRMTKDPDLRFSPNGVPVCSFTIAVNRFGKNDEADFPNIVCFKKTAENTANFCNKGSLVGIDGRLQTRTYKNNDNKTVYITEVLAESVQFLDSKPKEGQQQKPKQEKTTGNEVDPFANSGQINISDDDLPF